MNCSQLLSSLLQSNALDGPQIQHETRQPSVAAHRVTGALHVLVSLKFRSGGRLDVCDIHVVRCCTTSLEEGKTTPRVYLPRPGRTAFLVFWRTAVLFSTQKHDVDDNEMDEGTEDRGAFEDLVDFRGI